MVPIFVCGDGCSVNMKGSRLLEEQFGLKSPFTRGSLQAASETIQQAAISKSMSSRCGVIAQQLKESFETFLPKPKMCGNVKQCSQCNGTTWHSNAGLGWH